MKWIKEKILAEVRRPENKELDLKLKIGLKGLLNYKNVLIDNKDPVYSLFIEQYQIVEKYTILDFERSFMIFQAVNATKNIKGSTAECGVYKGGSSILIAMNRNDTIHFALDTFEGFPDIITDLDLLKSGGFSEASSVNIMELFGNYKNIRVLKGSFTNSFPYISDNHFSFVHIDSDLYISTKECCNFFYSRMSKSGIMLFDDYLTQDTPGVKKAVDEFFKDKIECPIILPTCQAIVHKL